MNRRLLLLAASCLLPLGVHANDIEPGKEYYTAIKAVDPIVLDGDLSEWTGSTLLADPAFSFPKGSADDPDVEGDYIIFEEYNGGTWAGPDDQTSAVQVVYDDENVYFGFVVTDDYHENSRNDAWNGDSVQLMVANAERDQQIALYNYALGGVEGDLGEVIVQHEARPDGGADTEAVITRDAENKKTTYEIKLPLSSMALDSLDAGVQFGLGMAINDGDDGAGQDGQKGWSGLGAHSIVHGKSPEQTARVTLARANDMEPGKEFHSARRATGDIVLDGELDDWLGVPILSDPRFTVEKGVGSRSGAEMTLHEEWNGGSWTGPDDQTSAVQVTYDDENVYFAFVVTDDYHENSRNDAWNGDSVQLMVANDKTDTQIALYNYALGGVEGDTGEVIVQHEARPDGGPDTEAVITRNGETKKTIYEIKLPKAAMGLEELTSGVQFGLGMAINDGDDGAGQDGQKGWGGLGAHSIVHGKTPQETALVTLDGYAPPQSGCFASAIAPPLDAAPDLFTFRLNSVGNCVVDPESVVLYIDGEPVPLESTEAGTGVYDFKHVFPDPYEQGTRHTYTIQANSTEGELVINESAPWSPPTFFVFTPDMKAGRVDKSKPGFLWRIFQNELYTHNSLTETELALSGGLVDIDGTPIDENLANDSIVGPAIGSGEVVGDAELVQFEIPGVINLNAVVDEDPENDAGSFAGDLQMPGLPGLNDSPDGANGEILTYVDFPAGRHTMGVNSDDGFRMEGGPFDQAETIGEFGRGRGSFDTIFRFEVEEAGIYPVRVIWFNGTGGATLEIFSVLEDGTKVLLNDVENGGFPAYRSAPESFLITDYSQTADELSLTWQSKVGRYYAVDSSTDMMTWENLVTTYPDGGATAEATSYTGPGMPFDVPQRYYRVSQVAAPALYFTDFENGEEGWTATNDSGDTWELGTPAAPGIDAAASGENAWGVNLDGNYAPSTFAYLRSPVIDVSSDASPKLSFNYFIDSVFEAEGGQIRFLDENGENPVAIEEILWGQSEGWKPYSIRFPSAARGGKVIIEFRFLTDDDPETGAGWYIDDVQID